MTSDDTPEHRDIGADTRPVTEDDPDADWELMQDEGRWPGWL